MSNEEEPKMTRLIRLEGKQGAHYIDPRSVTVLRTFSDGMVSVFFGERSSFLVKGTADEVAMALGLDVHDE